MSKKKKKINATQEVQGHQIFSLRKHAFIRNRDNNFFSEVFQCYAFPQYHDILMKKFFMDITIFRGRIVKLVYQKF